MIKFRTTHYHCTWLTTLKYILKFTVRYGIFFKRARVCTHKGGHFLIQFEAINGHLHVLKSWLQRICFDSIRFFLYYLPKLVNKVVESVLLISFSCTFDRNFTLIFMLLALMCLL